MGYTAYVDLIRARYPEKAFLATAMRGEVERCRMALEAACGGRTVAVVSSGDAGVYGMAGLVYELAQGYDPIDIEVVPGVTAACSGAALLGAPLIHDFAVISLSDLLTPWELIERRLDAAGRADFCICLYNPRAAAAPATCGARATSCCAAALPKRSRGLCATRGGRGSPPAC